MAEQSQNRIPYWAWIFAAACAAIPFLTRGGAIPGAIGIGGAAACLAVARDVTKLFGVRLAICGGIVLLCWILLAVLVAVVTHMQG